MAKAKKGWEIIEEFKSDAEVMVADQRLDSEFNSYILRGKQLVYKDSRNKQVIELNPGTLVPTSDGKMKEVPYNVVNYPVDPHICTISRSVTAQVVANELELICSPGTNEQSDRQTSENSSNLLRYYSRKLKLGDKQAEIAEWIKPCRCVFVKVWWDNELGDGVPDPMTGETVKLGDPNVRIVPLFGMMIPSGATGMDELDKIGEKLTMPISKIKQIWGKDVQPEANIRDTRSMLRGRIGAELKNHATVYEVFIKPCNDYPKGYHIIGANGNVFEQGEMFDSAWMSKFPDRWHPYIKIDYIKIAGEFWPISLFDLLIPMQFELNRLRRKISEAKPYTKPIVIADINAVDWEKTDLDPEKGLPRIEVKIPGSNVGIEWPRPVAMDMEQHADVVIQRMNDLSNFYEVTRGNTDPSVTSGKQAQVLQQASNTQGGPLLKNIAAALTELGTIVLELCASHFDSNGARIIEITGKNNESIKNSFKPEDINTKNVVVKGGKSIFMSPEAKQEQVDAMAQMGVLGDIVNDPIRRRQYLEQKQMPDIVSAFDPDMSDVERQQLENSLFAQGKFMEDNPQVIRELEKKWLADQQMQYQAQVDEYSGIMQAAANGEIPAQDMRRNGPPQEPGVFMPQPPPQQMYWRQARLWENDDIHIYELDKWLKTPDFDELCQKNPNWPLLEVVMFHRQSHEQNKTSKMPQPNPMALMPPQGNQAPQ